MPEIDEEGLVDAGTAFTTAMKRVNALMEENVLLTARLEMQKRELAVLRKQKSSLNERIAQLTADEGEKGTDVEPISPNGSAPPSNETVESSP